MAASPYSDGYLAAISQLRGASSALWIGPPRVGLGGYAPLPTARDGTDPQGSRDHPTGKCTGIVNGRQSMRRPQGPPSEGVESCRTLLDARRGPAADTWSARGDRRMGSGESRRAPLADRPLAECIGRCSPGAPGFNTVFSVRDLRGVESAEPYAACFLLSIVAQPKAVLIWLIPDGVRTGEASVV